MLTFGEEVNVSFILSFLFVILILASAFMQASDNALKKTISPGLLRLSLAM